MPRDPAYIRDFKIFTRGDLTEADLPTLVEELYVSSDRAGAVMACSLLDASLDVFLRHKVRRALTSDDKRRLFDPGGPLHDLSAKTLIAYAFKLIGPETKSDLDHIRLLRNGFAHSPRSINFSTPVVAEVCKHLYAPDWPGAYQMLHGPSDKSRPLRRYIIACNTIGERMLRHCDVATEIDLPELR
jgi:hypothetical protein